MVWYSHLFQNFSQFIVIHTVKGFGIDNKAAIGVLLDLSCFLYDPADVGNLISYVNTYTPAYTQTRVWTHPVQRHRATFLPWHSEKIGMLKTHSIKSQISYSLKDFRISKNIFSLITICISLICQQTHDVGWL